MTFIAGAVVTLGATGVDASSTQCPVFGSTKKIGETRDELGLKEASGLVASRINPGVYWTHNDNKGDGRLYALDGAGRVLAVVTINGLEVGSIEEIASSPRDASSDWLWLGDIGDNADARQNVAFHRIAEPTIDPTWSGRVVRIPWDAVETFRVAYRQPGSSETWGRDSEAFIVDPITGDLFLFEKKFQHLDGEGQLSWVYRVGADDLAADRVVVAEPITPVKARLRDEGASFTAATISRDGRIIMVKNMFEVFVWLRSPGGTVGDALVADQTAPCMAPAEKGEGIAISPNGSSYVMLREGPRTPIWQVAIGDAGRATTSAPTSTLPPNPRPTTTPPPTTAPPTTAAPTTAAPTTAPPTTAAPTTAAPTTTTTPPTTAAPTTTAPTTTTIPPTGSTIPWISGAGAKSWCLGVRATIVGTPGDDLIIGTEGPDVIDGQGGDDIIIGNGGDDLICGKGGNDVIRGGSGNDTIIGGGGADRLFGGSNNDLLRGQGGNDLIDGGWGDDAIYGYAGKDTLRGRQGTDKLDGGVGLDECDGGAGPDIGTSCEATDSL